MAAQPVERSRAITAVLVGLVALDASLTAWAFFAPSLWFRVFHGERYDDPAGFLYRCGANWAAFFLLQTIALARWRARPEWLAVIAGVRLADTFTDVTYLVACRQATWFAKATLPLTSTGNLLIGLFLLREYRKILAREGR